jgi:1-acyl-sn-glycerol-3-phosphate acyltransferase
MRAEHNADRDVQCGVSIGPHIPRRGNRVSRGFGRLVLRAMGWRIEGAIPDVPKLVVIGAPHTSNMDALVALAAVTALGLRIGIMGKHSLFRGPLDPVLRWLGFFPVDRRNPAGMVASTVDALHANQRFLLGLAPEGTRKAAREWRRGFWNIASAAAVPVLPAAFDYPNRRIVIGAPILAQGDYASGLRRVLEFYRRNAGPRHPEWASWPICEVLGLQPRGGDSTKTV